MSNVSDCGDISGRKSALHPRHSPSLMPMRVRLFPRASTPRVTPENVAVICCTKFFCEYGRKPLSSQ